MKIYVICRDPAYASIIIEDAESATDISDLRADEIENFHSPSCRLLDFKSKIGNFYHLNDTALVFDKNTDIAMGDFIEYAGLIHPLKVEGIGELGLLNVCEDCNPIDKNNSEWIINSWQETLALNKLKFHEQRVSSMSSLFKIPELGYRPILTYSDASTKGIPQRHDFYKFYHDNNMTGLVFQEIWSSS